MAFDLSGYEDVASRVARFQDAFPMGRITVRVLDFDKERGSILVEASIYRTDAADEAPAAVDIAMEWNKKSNVSEKWWVENAATSAIGRAISSVLPTPIKATRESMAVVNELERKATPPAARDPWTITDAVETLQTQLGAEVIEEAPLCAHGHMIRKEGEKKTGEPYVGYLCPEKNKAAQCKPRWGTLQADGKWSF